LASHSGGEPEKRRKWSLLKREEIKKLEARQAEIAEGQLIVLAQDEYHLLWGDTTGYGWGRRNEETEVPIQNIKQRQIYYGALNLYHRDFVLMPHDGGNGESRPFPR